MHKYYHPGIVIRECNIIKNNHSKQYKIITDYKCTYLHNKNCKQIPNCYLLPYQIWLINFSFDIHRSQSSFLHPV